MARRVAAVLMLLILIVPLLSAQSSTNDDRLYDEVRRRLANDTEVKGAGIDVAVMNGVVTLKGRASSEKARRKATSIVQKIKGVVKVDNQLKLFGVD